MADRVALSVQASQDQQNNSVKHPEISIFTLFTSNRMSLRVELVNLFE